MRESRVIALAGVLQACRLVHEVATTGRTSETALRVTSRALELALAPEYQASTIVRSRPKAVMATTMPFVGRG